MIRFSALAKQKTRNNFQEFKLNELISLIWWKKTFFDVLETPLNQLLLKINSKTLDNAYLTIVYLHTI